MDERFADAVKSLPAEQLVAVIAAPESWAGHNHCWTNCGRKVPLSGGARRCGWSFGHHYQSGGVVIAYPHAVWESPAGRLVDITPRPERFPPGAGRPLTDTEGRLIFLPDGSAFRQPNRYLPLTKNKDIIRQCRRLNRQEYQTWSTAGAIEARISKAQRKVRPTPMAWKSRSATTRGSRSPRKEPPKVEVEDEEAAQP
jgi:hypothetical protein